MSGPKMSVLPGLPTLIKAQTGSTGVFPYDSLTKRNHSSGKEHREMTLDFKHFKLCIVFL
jgi:hypothetical protein